MKNKASKMARIRFLTVILCMIPLIGICQDEEVIFMKAMDIKDLKLEPEQQKIVDRINKSHLTNAVFGLTIENISEVIGPSSNLLYLMLPGYKDTIVAVQSTFEFTSNSDYKWFGEFDDLHGDLLIISKKDGFIGMLSIEDKVYDFQSLVKGKNILIEYNTGLFNQGGDMPPINTGSQDIIIDQDKTSHTVTVLLLYTDQAQDYCDGIGKTIHQHATLTVADMQSALDISVPDGNVTIDTVAVEEFDFNEDWGYIEEDWDTLKTDALGRRNSTDADLVVLITDASPVMHTGYWDSDIGDIYGYAPYYGPDEPNAYAIVEAHYAYNHHTFAHEVGHLFGCDHQSGTGYNHAYGFTLPNPKGSSKTENLKRSTILYVDSSYVRICRYSNPDITYFGEEIGVENSNDNARKIENTAGILKYYRPFAKGSQLPSPIEIGNQMNIIFDNKVEIYPNPLSESTTIRYYLEEPSYVQIKLLDLTGRVCKTISEDYQSKGLYNLSLGDIRLKNGIYICLVNVGENQMRKKLFIQ